MRLHTDTVLFVLMCLIWGLTWIAMKAGISDVPPLLFAGTRFVTAGTLLYAYLVVNGASLAIKSCDMPRFLGSAVLLITGCYGLLFWGTLFINSGTAAMLELSFTPVALLGFALIFREERFSGLRAAAIALGIGGLILLFIPKVSVGSDPKAALGAAAVVAAALVYGLGSVLSQPLLRGYPTQLVAAFTTFWGGALLAAGSLAFEPGSWTGLDGRWGLAAWSGWAFLVLFGSLVGFTIYLRLLERWGASRAGAFAFVSPVIAVGAGAIVYGERISWLDGVGMAVMLAAAWLAIQARSSARTPPIDPAMANTLPVGRTG